LASIRGLIFRNGVAPEKEDFQLPFRPHGSKAYDSSIRLVHVPEPVDEHFHYVPCEEGILLDDEMEAPFIDTGQSRRFGGDDRGNARCAVDERHFTEQRPARGLFHRFAADPNLHRTLQEDEHAVALFTFAEKDFASGKIGRFGFVLE
jgi:hypothetical protein